MLKTLYQSFVVVLALLALPFAVLAQADFRFGYIIALKGDTLRGSVDYGSGNRSASEYRFRPDNAAAGVQTSRLHFDGEISVKDAAINGGARPMVGLTLQHYMPLNGRFRPFTEAGISVGFALTNSNEYRYRAQPTSSQSPWRPILDNPRVNEESILAGLGASTLLPDKRHLTAGFRAERTNSFSEAVGVSTGINRVCLSLSYDLSKSC